MIKHSFINQEGIDNRPSFTQLLINPSLGLRVAYKHRVRRKIPFNLSRVRGDVQKGLCLPRRHHIRQWPRHQFATPWCQPCNRFTCDLHTIEMSNRRHTSKTWLLMLRDCE